MHSLYLFQGFPAKREVPVRFDPQVPREHLRECALLHSPQLLPQGK